MKFTQKLATHLTPEWRSQYINYEELKDMLITATEGAPNKHELGALQNYYAFFDEQFFEKCESELIKVNTFYDEKIAEAKRRYTALTAQLKKAHAQAEIKGHISMMDYRAILNKQVLKAFKFDYSELYLSLVLLQNYQTLNHTGFRKILKKHDKLLQSTNGQRWFLDKVDSSNFYKDNTLMNLIQSTENTFTYNLEGGDRSRAMKRLRVPPLEEIKLPWTTVRVGLFSGIFLVLAISIYLSYKVLDLHDSNTAACFRLHRGPLLMIIFLFFIGINIHGWRKAGVNHILIFEIDPRDNLSALHLIEMSAALAVIWALSVLGFLHSAYIEIPPFAFPLTLLVIMICFLVNPIRIWYFSSRIWLLKLVGRVVAAPFFEVGFADFWLGDQLNSLAISLVDFEYIICFYSTNWSWYTADDPKLCKEKDFFISPIFYCLPAWFRLMQSLRRYCDTKKVFPFLVNAGKYALTFPVVIFATLMSYHKDSYKSTFANPYVWGFLIFHTIASIYCYAWDVLRDFGLFKKFSGENIFLREYIIYPPVFYYFAIIENFVLRFFWVLSFYLIQQDVISAYNISTIACFLEVYRRFIWNYLRLENEHLFNVGKFRAVRDIFVAPINHNDQITIQRMMDEMDTVETRHSSKEKSS